ncbi:ABC transporter permease [Bacillus subtilis]|nr:ABC transporter permease [Bacillus subtilis]
MIDALRDRKTILLTILVPMIMMLGLVFFYESMLSDKGEQYTLAVGHSLPPALESKLNEIDEISVKTFAKPEEAVDEGKADAYLNVPKEFDSYVNSMTPFKVDVYGNSIDQGSSNAMQLVQSALDMKACCPTKGSSTRWLSAIRFRPHWKASLMRLTKSA